MMVRLCHQKAERQINIQDNSLESCIIVTENMLMNKTKDNVETL